MQNAPGPQLRGGDGIRASMILVRVALMPVMTAEDEKNFPCRTNFALYAKIITFVVLRIRSNAKTVRSQ